MNKVMRNRKVIAVAGVVVLAMALLASQLVASPPMGAADPPLIPDVLYKINYQGQLTDSGGNPLDGTYDMQFLFYDAATGGSPVRTITKNDVTVSHGLFSVKLDIWNEFRGRWLEVKVEGETLSPRQEILAVPYALSLKAGAEIRGSIDLKAALSVINTKVADIWPMSDSEIGIYGESTDVGGVAVYGNASYAGPDTHLAYQCGGYFVANGPKGYGVRGIGWTGVYGESTEDGYGGYFKGQGDNACGIYARGGQDGYAADFKGNVIIRSLYTDDPVVELGQGLDYAEGFDVSDKKDIGPGSVLIIDPDNPGKLTVSDKAYDSKVAGIVAGAKEFSSGVRLGPDQFDYDVALAGRVYCNVDATESAVEPGDLLTTSAIPGYAMKVTDYELAQGAILGKAMERLEEGERGQILVLVTLQ
jgi:hypothetical protein